MSAELKQKNGSTATRTMGMGQLAGWRMDTGGVFDWPMPHHDLQSCQLRQTESLVFSESQQAPFSTKSAPSGGLGLSAKVCSLGMSRTRYAQPEFFLV